MDSAFDCPSCGHHFHIPGTQAVGLSRRQLQILTFIVQRAAAMLPPPTVQDVATALGCASKGHASASISILVALGYLYRIPRRMRGMSPTTKTWDLFKAKGHADAA